MQTPPTLFFDQNRWFVKYAVQQARKTGHKVVILRNYAEDTPTCDTPNIPNERISRINELYVHLSENPYRAEYYALARWFYFDHYMQSNDIDKAMICDSDVLIFESPHEIWNQYDINKNRVGLLCTSMLSGGTCIISSKMLNKFCSFVLDQYEYQRDSLITEYKKGANISDMTFFTKFISDNLEFEPICLNNYDNKLVIDDSTIIKNKLYKFNDTKPFLRRNGNQIALLHYQGSNKYLMPFHNEDANLIDILKNIHRIVVYWANSKIYLKAKIRNFVNILRSR